MKAMRQSRSGTSQPIRPPTMPLMPAMRPVVSISSAAERPISAPPMAADSGVKLAIGNLVRLAHGPCRHYARARLVLQRRKAFPWILRFPPRSRTAEDARAPSWKSTCCRWKPRARKGEGARPVGAAGAKGLRRHGAADRRLGRDVRGGQPLDLRPGLVQ